MQFRGRQTAIAGWLVCGAVVGVWVRSYWRQSGICFGKTQIQMLRGDLSFAEYASARPEGRGWFYDYDAEFASGFAIAQAGIGFRWYISVPLWVPILLFGPLIVCLFRVRYRWTVSDRD